MLGLGDWQIVAALVGCIVVTLFGVVYGISNWNSGSEPEARPHHRARRRRRRRKR